MTTSSLLAAARLGVAGDGKRLLAAQVSVDPKRLGPGRVEAVTSVFDVEFTEGGFESRQVVIHKGAFTQVLIDKPTAPIMWQHAWDSGPIGRSIEEEETGQGLRMLGELFIDDDPLARRVWKAMLPRTRGGKGALEEWSIGFWVIKSHEEKRRPGESLWHYTEIDRAEHSVVLRGANPLTETISVNAAGHRAQRAATGMVDGAERLFANPVFRRLFRPTLGE
jgi:HK97 family phage prohead protease